MPNFVRAAALDVGIGMLMANVGFYFVVLTAAASPVKVKVKGGDTLRVGFDEPKPHEYTNVTLFGPADFVFEGQVSI